MIKTVYVSPFVRVSRASHQFGRSGWADPCDCACASPEIERMQLSYIFCRKIIGVRLLSEELLNKKISWKERNVTISQYSEIMCKSERAFPCSLYLLSLHTTISPCCDVTPFPNCPKTNRKYILDFEKT